MIFSVRGPVSERSSPGSQTGSQRARLQRVMPLVRLNGSTGDRQNLAITLHIILAKPGELQ